MEENNKIVIPNELVQLIGQQTIQIQFLSAKIAELETKLKEKENND